MKGPVRIPVSDAMAKLCRSSCSRKHGRITGERFSAVAARSSSDALETVINVVAAIGALVALWFAEQPADANHPYGHNKAEYLSAVVEGALVLATALTIGHAAWLGWQTPHPRGARGQWAPTSSHERPAA
jgi:hypothetical protein